jgi:hypothetical protein
MSNKELKNYNLGLDCVVLLISLIMILICLTFSNLCDIQKYILFVIFLIYNFLFIFIKYCALNKFLDKEDKS